MSWPGAAGPRRPPGLTGLVIESGLTEITDDTLRFRGLDALDLARDRAFEEVSALLWTGSLAAASGGPAGVAGHARRRSGRARAAQAALPPGTLPLERLQVIVPALAAADPLRLHLDPPAVIAAGRAIIGGMVDCLPAAGPAATGRRPTRAGRDRRPGCGPSSARTRRRPGLLDALRAALVLLADHELAASTLAARVAASVRADPYAVVATGLGALGGALHGGASLGAEAMLAAAQDPADAPAGGR